MNFYQQIPDGWKEKQLRDIGKCISGLTYSPDDVTDDSGLLVLRSSNVQGGKLVFEDNVFVKKDMPINNIAQNGDILICVRNGSRNLIGKNALITKEGEGLTHGAFMILFRSKFNNYIYQLFDSEFYKKQVHRNLGATINSINNSDFYKFRFLFPPQKEQKVLAELLSTWDRAIDITERLIKAKKLCKLYELNSLIYSNKSNTTIGSFAKPIIRKIEKPKDTYTALGIRSHFKGTFQRIIENPDIVKMETLFRVDENDLIVNITFAWEGAIALVQKKDKNCLVSHRFPTFEINRNKAEPSFINQIIKSARMKYNLGTISPGGAGRNRVLNKKDFLKLRVWIPDLETQKQIGKYFEGKEKEIDLLNQLLRKYKIQKRGLLQKLLTGKWRVKVEE